jgi:predicted metal-dependent phosphoesterase TrpH
MASRLERKRGLPVRALVAELLSAAPVPTRTHLARALSAAGHARNTGEAFERLLGRGRPGYVPAQWPALGDSLSQIRMAGGYPVLAHPHRYGLGARVFSELIGEFAAGGGAALEISSAGVSPNDRDRIATQARRWRLAGSGGSDFHDPAVPWNSPGRFAKLPDDIEPIAARFDGTAGTHDRER